MAALSCTAVSALQTRQLVRADTWKALPIRSRTARFSRTSRVVRAAATEESSVDVSAIVEDVKAKWDKVEDKPTVVLYTGGALATLWLSSSLVSAVNAVPVLPKLLELVGAVYTAWFVYRYLLFKSSRAELAVKVEELKSKIAGK